MHCGRLSDMATPRIPDRQDSPGETVPEDQGLPIAHAGPIALTMTIVLSSTPVRAADRVIRWTTAGAVAGVAAMASYEHAHALVQAHGEAGRTERPPLRDTSQAAQTPARASPSRHGSPAC